MDKKISKEKLEQIIDKVREETKKDLSEQIQEIYGPGRQVPLDEVIHEVLPKLLSSTFVIAGLHAEYVIHDVLSELDLLTDDDD